jgi:endonuclease III
MNETLIVKIAKERFKDSKSQIVHFVDNEEANQLLNNLEKYPHAYVLACLMDRQIIAERAWIIPFEIYNELKSFDFNVLQEVSLLEYKTIFNKKKLHRFNDIMADVFYSALNDLSEKYNGNAGLIWSNKPSSASVVYRFMEFKGSGIKISTMAVNILARQFRIPFSDCYSIDISPDVHVVRVMKRMGFVPFDASNEMIIYKARELNPEFPGVIDFSCWEIGKNWCRPNNPDCNECIIKDECKRMIIT